MLFSILICSLDSRKDFLDRLLHCLTPQVQYSDDVEIIVELDDGTMSIGAKRNKLLKRAKGEYIAFIDDDDLVSSTYVHKVLKALSTKPDCVGIHLLHFENGHQRGFTYHSLDYKTWYECSETTLGTKLYYRNPNHLNPVKRVHALATGFPEISMGEDKDYSERLLRHLHTEVYIREPLYFYFFITNK